MAVVASPVIVELSPPDPIVLTSYLQPQDTLYARKSSTSSTHSTLAPSTSSKRRGTRKAVPSWTGSLEQLTLSSENARELELMRLNSRKTSASTLTNATTTSSILSPQPTVATAGITKALLDSSPAIHIPFDSDHSMRQLSKPAVKKECMAGSAVPHTIAIPTRFDSLSPHHHVLAVDPPSHAMFGTPVVSKYEGRHSDRTNATSSIGSASSHFSNLFYLPTSPKSSMATSQTMVSLGPPIAEAGKKQQDLPTASNSSRHSERTGDWVDQQSHARPVQGRQGSSKADDAHRKPVIWSVLEELERKEASSEQRSPAPKIISRRPRIAFNVHWNEIETRHERKERKRAEHEAFNVEARRIPDIKELFEVSQMEVTAEDGTKVKFGDIVGGGGGRKTVVVFIRHWYCPLCAEYMESIVREVDLDALERANVNVVVIGNGSSKMAAGYRKIFKCPFTVYTDTKLRVYRGLGMTRQTMDGGPETLKGDYITKGAFEGTLMVVKNAHKMPIRKPGAFAQLGGEFIFTSPLNCTFANRMINTRDHAPIREVVAQAGVVLDFVHRERGPTPPLWHRLTPTYEGENDAFAFGNWGQNELEITPAQRLAMEERRDGNGEGWRVDRERELERIRNDRTSRRLRMAQMGLSACDVDPGEEEEDSQNLEQITLEGSATTTVVATEEEDLPGQAVEPE